MLDQSEIFGETYDYHDEYTMIRAKKIDYFGESAIAVYFQNMTQHVNELRLEAKVLMEKNRNQ